MPPYTRLFAAYPNQLLVSLVESSFPYRPISFFDSSQDLVVTSLIANQSEKVVCLSSEYLTDGVSTVLVVLIIPRSSDLIVLLRDVFEVLGDRCKMVVSYDSMAGRMCPALQRVQDLTNRFVVSPPALVNLTHSLLPLARFAVPSPGRYPRGSAEVSCCPTALIRAVVTVYLQLSTAVVTASPISRAAYCRGFCLVGEQDLFEGVCPGDRLGIHSQSWNQHDLKLLEKLRKMRKNAESQE